MKLQTYFDTKYLINEFCQIFSKRFLINDLIAGITVALVAIPLSLAVAMASGAPPATGLVSAIIGGLIATFFGGATLAITGPAVAMTVIMSECISDYGMEGLLIMGVICGSLQICCGVLQLGRFTKLIPSPIVSAFISAIGFTILVEQLPQILQIQTLEHHQLIYLITHINHYIDKIHIAPTLIVLLTLSLIVLLPLIIPFSLALLIAIAIPTILVYLFHFPYVSLVSSIPNHLPIPQIPNFSHIHNWHGLLISSFAIFVIASLETLLSADALSNITKTIYQPNQELIGQGFANLGVSIFGGLPVTGVIVRSSVNVIAGAKTRRSGLIHALTIIILVYIFPKAIEIIPISILIAILIIAGLKMLNISQVINYWKNDKSDVLIYLVTFISIVSSSLINGIQTGLVLVIIITGMRLLATKSNMKVWSNKSVIRISLSGNMSFWSFEPLHHIQEQVLQQDNIKFVIFEFYEVQGIDSNGAKHLIDTATEISNHKIKVIFHGMSTEQNKLLELIRTKEDPFTLTVTENQIKHLLEKDGITHLANDVLRHGISKFSERFSKDHKSLIETLANGQKPHTILITCSDSRLNPNVFFGADLGELFIVRNVGNVIPKYSRTNKYSEVAAIEFALGSLEIRNIVICAHTECGAIKASIKEFDKPANSGLDNWLQFIKDGYPVPYPQNDDDGCKINLLNQVKNLKTYPIIQELLSENQLTISAWIYDVRSAQVFEWNEQTDKFGLMVKDVLTTS